MNWEELRTVAPNRSVIPATSSSVSPKVAVIGTADSISPVISCSFFSQRGYSSSNVSDWSGLAGLRA